MDKEMLDYALEYAEKGYPVFTLQPGKKKPMGGTKGFQDASTNEAIITRWWDKTPDANIGIATGKELGMWVLDIDGPDGSQSLTKIEEEIGEIPITMEQRTGGGGRQLFFKWHPTREIRNKQSLRPGIDVRGEGGYIVVPPSLHPSGQRYEWEEERPPVSAPAALLDIVAPKKKNIPPWELHAKPEPRPPEPPSATPVIERASRYLRECEPAIQGSGGHDALLWAARAMVVGFELSDADALYLLWHEFNPRCAPSWDPGKPGDKRDFERKVSEARRTPGKKSRGWLLDEYELRSGLERLAEIGKQSADNLLAQNSQPTPEKPTDDDEEVVSSANTFPIEYLPGSLSKYAEAVKDAHVVDESFVGLPMLVAAGAAMGNVWRLELKKGFMVPPTLWGGIVADSGTNKSGPMDEVVKPMQDAIPIDEIADPMLNPQSRMVASDTTREALVKRLGENPRGMLVFRDELAGWVLSFNSYKQGGDDEQAWIGFWNAKEYYLDRKTDDEQIFIPAAAVAVLGGIQPQILAESFDMKKFNSGLVPRLIITSPPVKDMYWTEKTVPEELSALWDDVIKWLRKRAFLKQDLEQNKLVPHVLKLDGEAKEVYRQFFDHISRRITKASSSYEKSILSKARLQAGRLSLIHHGLLLATEYKDNTPNAMAVGMDSVKAGTAWAEWALQEQLRVYGFVQKEYKSKHSTELVDLLVERHGKKKYFTPRDIQRLNGNQYPDSRAAKKDIELLIDEGNATWYNKRRAWFTLV